ncbi:protein of unknown function DUF1152 [Pyrolobus fumarii 1A]|uniref:DUF1152 domain-containing protein n=2 Tax=Pyrolobus fumarii TaxID=54252 RepID=G0EE12_PYRF1|nr:protein of unknown function DUF1152 [Pyrolobus fumarii 1A]
MVIEEVFGFKPRSVIVLAVGGGGDIASAMLNTLWLQKYGVRSQLAAIAWERFVIDPCPGPLRLEDFAGPTSRLSLHLLEVRGGCWVVRSLCGGNVFIPQVCRLARIASVPIYVVDVWGGSRGIAEALRHLASLTGAEAILAVDVGGDVLAEGVEDTLWSPLADAVGLAGSVESGLPVVAAVQSPGSDGELRLDEILERLGDIAAAGGLRAARLVSFDEALVLEEIVREGFVTEAGLAQLMARRGVRGVFKLRGGTRRVDLTVLQALVFYMDGEILYKLSPLARRVSGTWSLQEARARLNEACVFTELDLEEGLWREKMRGLEPNPARVRAGGRRALRLRCVAER